FLNTYASTSSLIPSPYTTLFRSAAFERFVGVFRTRRARPLLVDDIAHGRCNADAGAPVAEAAPTGFAFPITLGCNAFVGAAGVRSEEHTSELQSPDHLLLRFIL